MESERNAPLAWQPFTPAGVAAFATASFKRLWLVQLLIAVIAAGAVLWFMGENWFPVVRSAIRNLEGHGTIRARVLAWEGEPAVKLAENHFLALSVDLRHQGLVRSPAHLQLEFGQDDIVLLSVFGVLQVRYPDGYIISLNREDLEPWWGAWGPAVLAATAFGTILLLMLNWAVLALVYALIALLIAFFANRDLRFSGGMKLCGAAQMPGAVFMAVIIVLYGLGALDVLQLLIAAGFHFVIGWVYLILAVLFRPRIPGVLAPKANPFKAPNSGAAGAKGQGV